MMDLRAYHNALNQGFSESEASRIGDDAWENNRHQPTCEPEPEPDYYDVLAAENTQLRAELAKADGQINRCVEQNKYLESTISRLRDENKAAWDSAEYNARRARVAEAAIKKLLAFAEHDAECQGQPGYDIPCSCGYDELMKELEESK